uniref:Uncharacterized protein n=1 Tax=Trichuris muris TaxID=70415 RepID=A0A5S6QF92_TRIMR
MANHSGSPPVAAKQKAARALECRKEALFAKISDILGLRYSCYLRLLKRWIYGKDPYDRLKSFVNEHFGSDSNCVPTLGR